MVALQIVAAACTTAHSFRCLDSYSHQPLQPPRRRHSRPQASLSPLALAGPSSLMPDAPPATTQLRSPTHSWRLSSVPCMRLTWSSRSSSSSVGFSSSSPFRTTKRSRKQTQKGLRSSHERWRSCPVLSILLAQHCSTRTHQSGYLQLFQDERCDGQAQRARQPSIGLIRRFCLTATCSLSASREQPAPPQAAPVLSSRYKYVTTLDVCSGTCKVSTHSPLGETATRGRVWH